MHTMPAQIARLLRTFQNAYRLGLLRSVRISSGPDACEAASAYPELCHCNRRITARIINVLRSLCL